MIGELMDRTNLKALWHFNGDLADSGPSGYTLTLNGTVSDIAAGFGSGAKDFAGGYLTNASFPNFGATDEFTLGCWINPDIITVGKNYDLLSKQDGATRNFEISLLGSSAKVFFSNAVGAADVTSNSVVSTNSWHLILCTRSTANSGTNTIYIDGALDKTQTGCGNNGQPTGSLAVGTQADATTNTFDGKMDEVFMYNRAWSDQEVKDYYAWAKGLRSGVI